MNQFTSRSSKIQITHLFIYSFDTCLYSFVDDVLVRMTLFQFYYVIEQESMTHIQDYHSYYYYFTFIE